MEITWPTRVFIKCQFSTFSHLRPEPGILTLDSLNQCNPEKNFLKLVSLLSIFP